MIALETHTPSLQQGQMLEVEDRQFLVDNAVDGRVQLQAFLAVCRAARFGKAGNSAGKAVDVARSMRAMVRAANLAACRR